MITSSTDFQSLWGFAEGESKRCTPQRIASWDLFNGRRRRRRHPTGAGWIREISSTKAADRAVKKEELDCLACP